MGRLRSLYRQQTYGDPKTRESKLCSDCKGRFPLESFHRDRAAPDGRQYACIKCTMYRIRGGLKKADFVRKKIPDIMSINPATDFEAIFEIKKLLIENGYFIHDGPKIYDAVFNLILKIQREHEKCK